MARMLGTSRTIRWRLCTCRQCEAHKAMFRFDKRMARRRETRMWQREARA